MTRERWRATWEAIDREVLIVLAWMIAIFMTPALLSWRWLW